ncbi:MAG: rod shape-determining protein MreD [Ruminococcaceae bacterium]|jgi:rod shape-determining protein MreD|nr:rod shape-determining protein MreD [Oscillospiraceae bacterium]
MIKNKPFWRRIVVYLIYAAVCGLLQVTWPATLAILGQSPDLTLVLAVLAGYLFGSQDAFLAGLSAGLARDLLAGRVLGLGMLLLLYAALAAAVLLQRFFKRNVFFGLLQVAFFTLAYEVMIVLITFLIPLQPDEPYGLLYLLARLPGQLPGQLLANLAAAVPLAFLLVFLGPYKRSQRLDGSDASFTGEDAWRTS